VRVRFYENRVPPLIYLQNLCYSQRIFTTPVWNPIEKEGYFPRPLPPLRKSPPSSRYDHSPDMYPPTFFALLGRTSGPRCFLPLLPKSQLIIPFFSPVTSPLDPSKRAPHPPSNFIVSFFPFYRFPLLKIFPFSMRLPLRRELSMRNHHCQWHHLFHAHFSLRCFEYIFFFVGTG